MTLSEYTMKLFSSYSSSYYFTIVIIIMAVWFLTEISMLQDEKMTCGNNGKKGGASGLFTNRLFYLFS